jgi:outer membrane immunogenic protein
VVMGGPALAAETWTGLYVGVDGGLDWAKIKNSGDMSNNGTFDTFALTDIDTASTFRMHTIGASGGAKIGINYQIGHGFLGVEADYNTLTGSHSKTIHGAYTSTAFPDLGQHFTVSSGVEQKWLSSVRLRGGAVLEHSIVYVTAGVAEAETSYSAGFSDTVVPVAPVSAKTTKKLQGFVIGAGEEFRITHRLSCFFEILNTTLGSSQLVLPVSATDHYTSTGKFNDDVLRLGINLKVF